MNALREWWVEERGRRAVERLEAHQFKAVYVRNREEAIREIWKHLGPAKTVGLGGSITLRELGIIERLESEGKVLYDHWKLGLSQEQSTEIRRLQLTSDVFLSSVNAITLNGELINIDGIGNRVSGTIFGPGKVLLVAGYNKLVEDVAEGIRRIKNVATPLNARRLHLDLPCAKLGRCVDCNSPHRICCVTVIYERKPLWTDVIVIVVGEELGY